MLRGRIPLPNAALSSEPAGFCTDRDYPARIHSPLQHPLDCPSMGSTNTRPATSQEHGDVVIEGDTHSPRRRRVHERRDRRDGLPRLTNQCGLLTRWTIESPAVLSAPRLWASTCTAIVAAECLADNQPMPDRAELFPAEALAENRSGQLTGDQVRRFHRMVSGRRKSTRGVAVPVGGLGRCCST